MPSLAPTIFMNRLAARRHVLAFGVCLALFASAGCNGGSSPALTPTPDLPDGDGLLESSVLQDVVDLQVLRDGPALRNLLTSPDATVRARAALALGSVQDPESRESLLALLSDPDSRVRMNAAFALGQVGFADRGAAISLALETEQDPDVRRRLIEAIGKRGGPEEVLTLLSRGPDEGDPETWMLALSRGGIRGIRSDELMLALAEGLRDSEVEVRMAAGYFFGRSPTAGPWLLQVPTVREVLDGYDLDEPTAGHLVAGLANLVNVPVDRERAAYWLANATDWRVRAAVAAALRSPPWLGDEMIREALFAALSDPSEHVRVAAAASIGIMIWDAPDELARAAALMNGSEEDWRVQAEFVQALAANEFDELVRAWTRRMAVARPLAAQAGIEALAGVEGAEVTALFVELAENPDPLLRGTALRMVAQRWPQEVTSESGLPAYFELFRNHLDDAENFPAGAAATGLASPAFESLGGSAALEGAYRSHLASGDPNRLVPLVEAMGTPLLSVLHEAAAHPHAKVREAAVKTIAVVTQTPPEPAGAGVPGPDRTIDWSALAELGTEPRVEVETDRGTMVIRLFPEQAPLSVQGFVEQIRAGLHNDVRFHRVLPNFVVQGGDFAVGDGSGEPGYRLRSEFTQLPFRRGVLGMASSGKDTEGSQFFLTHSDQPHLDGVYTAFGWLESGDDVLDLIQKGDRVLEMRVLPGR